LITRAVQLRAGLRLLARFSLAYGGTIPRLAAASCFGAHFPERSPLIRIF
jgi:hypothetical protein